MEMARIVYFIALFFILGFLVGILICEKSKEEDSTKEAQLAIQRSKAKLQALKCVPKKGVFRVDELIREKNDKQPLLDSMVPYQKVILRRCFPQRSYCGNGMKCLPTKWKTKIIAVVLKNETETEFDYDEMMNINENTNIVTFLTHEHVTCNCG